MSYTVSREAAGSTVAFFESMHDRLEQMLAGAPIAAKASRGHLGDDEHVQLLVQEGLRLDEICRRCYQSEPTVRATLRRLGLRAKGMHAKPQNKRTRERRQRGMTLLLSGQSLTEVARECGVTKPTVHEWRLRLMADGLLKPTDRMVRTVEACA